MDIALSLESRSDGVCFICGMQTKVKTIWINRETRERRSEYFDLCESCKRVENCFTCLYSKTSYIRYKGRCDVSWALLHLRVALESDDKDYTIEKYSKLFELVNIDKNIPIQQFANIIQNKIEDQIKNGPDCFIYKTKKIGNTIGAFWNHKICKRFRFGNPTKEEYDDYHADDGDDDDGGF
jgi:hypothetical protein